jgi:HK97 family phage portal protein
MTLYAAHPWVYVCVQAIASAIASVRYKILDKKTTEEVKDEKVLAIFKNPNPHQTWFEFMEATIIYLELVGNTFLEEVRDNANKLQAIFPLRPDNMKIKPHPKNKIAGYIYSPTNRPGDDILYSPEEITHIKYFNPLNELWGISPGWASQNGLTLDFWSLSYNKGYFKRGAEPGFVLEAESSLSEAAYNRLLDAWKRRHEGVSKSHTPAILEEGLKYKSISPSQKDMQFTETRKMTREEILAAWRVPPVVVGLLEFASYASAREQRKIFWMDNIIPKLTRISEVINANMMDEGYEFKFDTESITSLIEDDKVAAEIGMQYTTHGVMTINEFRKKYLNLPAVKWGDVWWAPMGFAPIKDEKAPMPPAAPVPPGSVNSADPMQNGIKGPAFIPKPPAGLPAPIQAKRDPAAEYESLDKIERPEPDWTDPKEVWFWNRWTVWKSKVSSDVRKAEKQFLAFFRGQLERIKGRAKEFNWPKPKSVGKDEQISKADLPKEVEDWLLQIDKDSNLLSSIVQGQASSIMKKHGQIMMGELGLGGEFSLKNPDVVKWMEKYTASKVTQINETTRDALRRRLTESYEKGQDFKQAMEEISNSMDGPIAESRARRIAQTEIVTLTNQAKLQTAKNSGVVQKKTWISELLPSTRDSHRAVHGTTVGIDEQFEVQSRSGIDEMDGPGDITADPENLVNCYCILDFPPATPEFQDLFTIKPKRDSREVKKADVKADPPLVMKKKVRLVHDEADGSLIGHDVELVYEKPESKNGSDDKVPPG